MAEKAEPARLAFMFPVAEDLKHESGGQATVQVRVKEDIDSEVIKYAPLRLEPAGASGQPAKYFVARIRSGPGSRGWKVSGLKVDGLEQRGDLPHDGRVRITCDESILDDMAKSQRAAAAGDTPRTKKSKKQKRLQRGYPIVFEAVAVSELPPPTFSMIDFWKRAEAGAFGPIAEDVLVVNVKQRKKEAAVAVGPAAADGADGDAAVAVADSPPDYIGLSILICALLFAVYIFMQPIPEEVLPPCNATLNITDHCINASALNETLAAGNVTVGGAEEGEEGSGRAEETYDGENDGDDDDDDDDDEEDDEEEDYSAPGDRQHGDLRRRL